MISYGFYKQVMEFLAKYLGLENELLRMDVIHYDKALNGVKVLIAIYRVINNELISYCAVKFDNAMGRAEPVCSGDRDYVERVYGEMT